MLTGKTARRQAEMAEAAQVRQEQRIAEEKARVDAVDTAQRRVRTGGRGLLAFIDDPALKSTFGGAS